MRDDLNFWQQALEIMSFSSGYNTSIVIIGVILLGAAAGLIGCFTLLRRRALMSDAISHGTLPGLAIGFLTALIITGNGRNFLFLLIGAGIAGLISILMVQWIYKNTRLTEDTAIASVLSVTFGFGVVLLTYIQNLSTAGQAGLNHFLLGSTSGMLAYEAIIIGTIALAVTLVTIFSFKYLAVICFDTEYAGSRGWAVHKLDLLILALLLSVVVIGLRAVGLIMIVALLIIPPVTARLWTDSLKKMVIISIILGAISGYLGATLSAIFHDLPTGPIIVLTSSSFFFMSLLFAPKKGLIATAMADLIFRINYSKKAAALAKAENRPSPTKLGSFILSMDKKDTES